MTNRKSELKENKSNTMILYLLMDVIVLFIEALLYFCTILGPMLFMSKFQNLPVYGQLVLGILLWYIMIVSFSSTGFVDLSTTIYTSTQCTRLNNQLFENLCKGVSYTPNTTTDLVLRCRFKKEYMNMCVLGFVPICFV